MYVRTLGQSRDNHREEVDHILWLWGSATVYVESTWVHYIDFSAIVQVVKVSIIMSSVHVKISTLFVVSHFWSAQVSPEWRLNQGFATQKKCPFPLNRSNIYKDYVDIFLGPNSVPPGGRCPLNKSVQRRGSTEFTIVLHCIIYNTNKTDYRIHKEFKHYVLIVLKFRT